MRPAVLADEPVDSFGGAEDRPAGQIPRGELGRGSPFLVRLASNVAELRGGHRTAKDIADRAGLSGATLTTVERARVGLSVGPALRLAAAFERPFEALTEGIYWNPGEVAAAPPDRRADSERLRGYFSILPNTNFPAFGERPPKIVVRESTEVAAIIGRNFRDVRRRRNLSQRNVGSLEQTAVSRIERGLMEPKLNTLIAAARVFEVPLEVFLRGMVWEPSGDPIEVPRGALKRHDPCLLDAVETAGADASGVADGREATIEEISDAVFATVIQLREEKGWTQRQLGEAMECHGSFVARLERGGSRAQLYLSTLIRLAAGLGVPCSTLLGGACWDIEARCFRLPRVVGPRHRATAADLRPATRRMRRRLGLSSAALAARIGMSSNYFGAFETGQLHPKPITVLKLVRALGADDVAELTDGICDWYVRPLPPPAVTAEEESSASADRQRQILERWAAGEKLEKIGEELDMPKGSVFAVINRLREVGVDVPYRIPPVNTEQLAGRLRRRRAGLPASDPAAYRPGQATDPSSAG
jgi:transcriptional regulator with XRE-family HTH domain